MRSLRPRASATATPSERLSIGFDGVCVPSNQPVRFTPQAFERVPGARSISLEQLSVTAGARMGCSECLFVGVSVSIHEEPAFRLLPGDDGDQPGPPSPAVRVATTTPVPLGQPAAMGIHQHFCDSRSTDPSRSRVASFVICSYGLLRSFPRDMLPG